MRAICVLTHRTPAVTAGHIDELLTRAEAAGLDVYAAPGEAAKHPALQAAEAATAERGWPDAALESDYALVLGGDGTLLQALNNLRDGPVVVGVNFGTLGYLTAGPSNRLGQIVDALAGGRIESHAVGVLQVHLNGERFTAVNDIIAAGPTTGRIIQLRWRIVDRRRGVEEDGVHMGDVACDGMVASTALGSTAFSLSNGGPVLDWGVDSYIAGFIAPHTLGGRNLVLPRGRAIQLTHLGRGAGLRVLADGQAVGILGAGGQLELSLSAARTRLGLLPGASGLARYRDRFLAGNANPFDASRVQTADPDGGDQAMEALTQ